MPNPFTLGDIETGKLIATGVVIAVIVVLNMIPTKPLDLVRIKKEEESKKK